MPSFLFPSCYGERAPHTQEREKSAIITKLVVKQWSLFNPFPQFLFPRGGRLFTHAPRCSSVLTSVFLVTVAPLLPWLSSFQTLDFVVWKCTFGSPSGRVLGDPTPCTCTYSLHPHLHCFSPDSVIKSAADELNQQLYFTLLRLWKLFLAESENAHKYISFCVKVCPTWAQPGILESSVSLVQVVWKPSLSPALLAGASGMQWPTVGSVRGAAATPQTHPCCWSPWGLRRGVQSLVLPRPASRLGFPFLYLLFSSLDISIYSLFLLVCVVLFYFTVIWMGFWGQQRKTYMLSPPVVTRAWEHSIFISKYCSFRNLHTVPQLWWNL